MISKDLLEILCCPKCHGDLRYDESPATLTCQTCNQVYRIKDYIPIMLVDDKPVDPRNDD